jgi:hypothetical protein
VVVDTVFDNGLSDAQAAHDLMESNNTTGKERETRNENDSTPFFWNVHEFARERERESTISEGG